MISLKNKTLLIESASELPDFGSFKSLYLDLETTSCNATIRSVNPWDVAHCKVLMIAVAVDDSPVYCIPRHCISLSWLRGLLRQAPEWINQNVKYDAHVLHNELGIRYEGKLRCTIALAKIVDSDRTYRGGYGLDALVDEYLDFDISYLEQRLQPFLGKKNKDYAAIPTDILAEYAGGDIHAVRALYPKLYEQLDENEQQVYEVECGLTECLFELEAAGIRFDEQKVKIRHLIDLAKQQRVREQLTELLGYDCNPQSNDDCYDLFCNRLGYPVMYHPEHETVTFDKYVLADYKKRPDAKHDVIDLVSKYRYASNHVGLFWDAWTKLGVNGRVHANFNQNVRSGRMSCSKPNLQQLDEDAKQFLLPDEGYEFIERDYSQVEFRLIVHFINDPQAIAAYARDPFTDFHNLVRDGAGIDRDDAKTLNFLMGFGGGKKKAVRQLASSAKLALLGLTTQQMEAHGLKVYNDYHAMLPGLRLTSKKAERIARNNGYIRNGYGRKLRLPRDRAHVAFNRVVQSTAADLMKRAAVRCHHSEYARSQNWSLRCLVHDSFLFQVPIGDAERASEYYASILHEPEIELRVPIVSSSKHSSVSWGEAS